MARQFNELSGYGSFDYYDYVYPGVYSISSKVRYIAPIKTEEDMKLSDYSDAELKAEQARREALKEMTFQNVLKQFYGTDCISTQDTRARMCGYKYFVYGGLVYKTGSGQPHTWSSVGVTSTQVK